jgi:hypothetical protein
MCSVVTNTDTMLGLVRAIVCSLFSPAVALLFTAFVFLFLLLVQLYRRGSRALSTASITATAKAGKAFVNGKWVAAASGKTFAVTSECPPHTHWGCRCTSAPHVYLAALRSRCAVGVEAWGGGLEWVGAESVVVAALLVFPHWDLPRPSPLWFTVRAPNDCP